MQDPSKPHNNYYDTTPSQINDFFISAHSFLLLFDNLFHNSFCFLVFWYHDQILELVAEIVHEQYEIVSIFLPSRPLQLRANKKIIRFGKTCFHLHIQHCMIYRVCSCMLWHILVYFLHTTGTKRFGITTFVQLEPKIVKDLAMKANWLDISRRYYLYIHVIQFHAILSFFQLKTKRNIYPPACM